MSRPVKAELEPELPHVQKGITEWIVNWKRNGWRACDKKPVKNVDLWQALDALNQKNKINWQWVKGHDGRPENEGCDELTNEAIAKLQGRLQELVD